MSKATKKNYPETYSSWQGMRARCKSSHPKFANYKKLGYCSRWDSFEKFLADMGARPSGHSIDRINNSLGYSPDNCRWANKWQQAKNHSRTRWLTYKEETMSMADWARKYGMKPKKLYSRVNDLKWPLQKALETP